MYAILDIKGQQVKVQEGQVVKTVQCSQSVGETIQFDTVLFYTKDNTAQFGNPYVPGATVSAEVLEHSKDKKIVVFKYRRRKDSMSKNGHRQKYTRLRILSINAA